MNILIIGSGGREHALSWKCAQSDQVDLVFVAPGNAGSDSEPGVQNVALDIGNFDALTNFAKENNASVIIRGLRAVSDFDYEFQMASMNAKLAPDVETVCLMASDRHQFIASRLVKEIAILDGDVAQFVSPRVRDLLEEKVKNR